MQFPRLRRAAFRAGLLAVLATVVPAAESTAAAPGYLTLLFGRTQWVATSQCTAMNNTITLDQVAAEFDRRHLVGTGLVVTTPTEETVRCCHSGIALHASWTDLASLRDKYGWSFDSNGATHRAMTDLSMSQQLDESCGSLTELEAHGHTRGWGLFGYPNNKYTTTIQRNVVSSCFAYGRTYGSGTNNRAALVAPWFQKTLSVNGGACNDTSASCYRLDTPQRYASPDRLAAAMKPGPDQWFVVQAYRFVTGSRSGSGSQWDCTAADWRRHWTSRTELYCWADYLTALNQIPSGAVVTDPATVAQNWGRG